MKAFWNRIRPPKPLTTTGGFKVKMDKPPIWNEVCVAFGIKPEAYFTYGDTIYCVDVPFPQPDIIEHEKVHMEQQLAFIPPERRIKGNEDEGAALWWGKYLREPAFRVDQEAKAYGKQYAFICETVKDRNKRAWFLAQFAKSLSGPMYHNAVTGVKASKLIKQYSHVV